MRSNHFDSTILGTIHHGQAIAVEGTHRSALRVLIAKLARRLSLRLGAWRALKRMPATMTPATATCPSYSGSRFQRREVAAATMSGVVVDPGTVGVR
ncbi:MAG: hypothetical protein L0228_13665 [Planctomycetes bacterium]|nr:hypothetical protein [Planctomycetota bacterium]